jgi:hypothetical protein
MEDDPLGPFKGIRNVIYIYIVLGSLAVTGLLLASCGPGSPIGTGFEGHIRDMPVEPPIVIYVLRADEVMRVCGDVTKKVSGLRTEAMGCATEMPAEHPFRYVLICPPSWTVCVHEARHASHGDWH